jgi:exodeoxyribonuclease VIII
MTTAIAPEVRSGIFPMPAADYHADKSAISKSMLSDFRYSRRLFYHQHVACDSPAEKKSSRMDIGTLAHIALLEPERIDDAYAIFPRDVLAKNGAESTNAAEAFRNENEAAGRVVLKAHEFETVEAMRASVLRKVGHWLKVEKRVEHAVYWSDPATGLKCRCRPDWLIEQHDEAFIIDFKTTDDPKPGPFSRVAESFDYHLQDDHYSDGVSINLQKRVTFLFLVVSTQFPHIPVLYEQEPPEKAASARLRSKLMTNLAACHQYNDWSDDWEHDVRPLKLRPFAFE